MYILCILYKLALIKKMALNRGPFVFFEEKIDVNFLIVEHLKLKVKYSKTCLVNNLAFLGS